MTDYQIIEGGAEATTRSGAIKLHGPEGFSGMRAATGELERIRPRTRLVESPRR